VLDEIAQTVILSEAKNLATSIAKGFHQVKKRWVFFDQLELAGNGVAGCFALLNMTVSFMRWRI